MNEPLRCFITWTTYGSWLPGDARGWRKWRRGERPSQPWLEQWCRERMTEDAVLLNPEQRQKIEDVCRDHARIRGWTLHAVNARSNHVHVVVTTNKSPETTRDQFKANATRVLRPGPNPIQNERVWTRGGDCEVLDSDEDLEQVVLYVTEAQDRKNHENRQVGSQFSSPSH